MGIQVGSRVSLKDRYDVMGTIKDELKFDDPPGTVIEICPGGQVLVQWDTKDKNTPVVCKASWLDILESGES